MARKYYFPLPERNGKPTTSTTIYLPNKLTYYAYRPIFANLLQDTDLKYNLSCFLSKR